MVLMSVNDILASEITKITKRDFIAAMAMHGMMTNDPDLEFTALIKNSVLTADALIKELEPKNGQSL